MTKENNENNATPICIDAGGINWCWYIQGTVNHAEQTITITNYNRWHRFDYNQGAEEHPIANAHGRIIENEKGQAIAVELTLKDFKSTETYKVTNPAGVFSYRVKN